MMALLARAHRHGKLFQSPPAKKKQNRAASPTPAATTVEQPAWQGAQANSDINKTAEVRWIHRAGESYG